MYQLTNDEESNDIPIISEKESKTMPELKRSLKAQLNQLDNTLVNSELRVWHRRFQDDPDILNLSLGEPDVPVTVEVKDAIVDAIQTDASYYASTAGYEPLRKRISAYMTSSFQAPQYAIDEVLITVGATEGIYVTLKTLFQAGDAILVPTPTYPLYKNIAKHLEINVVTIDTTETDFRLTPDALLKVIEAHDNLKGFIFNDPTNPTGVVYQEEEISALAQVFAQTDMIVVTDEIYGALTYGTKHVTLAKYLPEQTIIVGGLSKSHAMPGYRLGFVLGPAEVMQRLTQVHQLIVGSVPMPLMMGAVAALDNEIGVETSRLGYEIKRDKLVVGLRNAGFTVVEPQGAFYVLVQVPDEWDDVGFVEKLAIEAKVGVLPGAIFDAPGYVRISFAGSESELIDAVQRMTDFMSMSGPN